MKVRCRQIALLPSAAEHSIEQRAVQFLQVLYAFVYRAAIIHRQRSLNIGEAPNQLSQLKLSVLQPFAGAAGCVSRSIGVAYRLLYLAVRLLDLAGSEFSICLFDCLLGGAHVKLRPLAAFRAFRALP